VTCGVRNQVRLAAKVVESPALLYSAQLTHGEMLTMLDECPRTVTAAFYDHTTRCIAASEWTHVVHLLASIVELRRKPIREVRPSRQTSHGNARQPDRRPRSAVSSPSLGGGSVYSDDAGRSTQPRARGRRAQGAGPLSPVAEADTSHTRGVGDADSSDSDDGSGMAGVGEASGLAPSRRRTIRGGRQAAAGSQQRGSGATHPRSLQVLGTVLSARWKHKKEADTASSDSSDDAEPPPTNQLSHEFESAVASLRKDMIREYQQRAQVP